MKDKSRPLLGVLLEQAGQQGLGLGRQVLGEADLLHEDQLKETLVVLVVEGQPAAHHLVHDHAQPPPVHRSTVVVVLQHLTSQSHRDLKVTLGQGRHHQALRYGGKVVFELVLSDTEVVQGIFLVGSKWY